MANKRKNRDKSSQVVTRSQVRGIVQGLNPKELKATYTQTTGTTTTGGTITYITALAQGDDVSNRTGDCIRMKKLEIRIAAVNTVSSVSRYIFFTDNNCQGALPGVSDLLTSASYNSLVDLRLVLQSHRFTILWDKTLVHNVAGDSQQFAQHTIKWGRSGKPIYFLGTGSTVAAAGQGSLFLLTIGKDVTTTLAVDSRIDFHDE